MANKKIVEIRASKLVFEGQVLGYRLVVVLDSGKIERYDVELDAVPQEHAQALASLVSASEMLFFVGDKYVTEDEGLGATYTEDISEMPTTVSSLVKHTIKFLSASKAFKMSGGNPDFTNTETSQFDRLRPLRGKHIFTKTYGDGEIMDITRKNDLSGMWVYFFTNADDVPADKNSSGQVKLDADVFLADIEAVRDIIG